MNKQQQIEEMASILEQAKVNALNTIGSLNRGFGVWYAEELYRAGYRKVDEVRKKTVETFAEKLKKCTYCDNLFPDGKWHRYIFIEAIDELLKEYEE